MIIRKQMVVSGKQSFLGHTHNESGQGMDQIIYQGVFEDDEAEDAIAINLTEQEWDRLVVGTIATLDLSIANKE